jgi:hypothetical protein
MNLPSHNPEAQEGAPTKKVPLPYHNRKQGIDGNKRLNILVSRRPRLMESGGCSTVEEQEIGNIIRKQKL